MVGVTVGHGPVDVLLIGAPKCGTTTLWSVLRSQDWFVAPRVKELHHFASPDPVADEVYRSWFPPSDDRDPERLRGEATPDYLSSFEAPRRIAEHNPDVRLVVALRDPVDRAVSAFQHARRVGAVPRGASLDQVYWDEARRRTLSRDWTRIRWDGMYGRHLARYLRAFRREQLHVLFLEELVADPDGALSSLGRFLGHPDLGADRLPHENASRDVVSPTLERLVVRSTRRLRRAGLLPESLALTRIRQAWAREPAPVRLEPTTVERLVTDLLPDVDLLETQLGRRPPWPRFGGPSSDAGVRDRAQVPA